MYLHIINYAVRIIIILLGVAIVSGIIPAPKDRVTLFNVMGVVFILFGLYRIVLYRLKSKEYDFSSGTMVEDNEEE